MQQRPRVRVESDHRRHGPDRARAFDHCLHDELMSEVQAVEYSESQYGRTGDLGVVGTVE